MSDNIYDMLNDNNIDLEELSKEGFNDFERKQIKNKFKKSINKNKNQKKRIIGIAIAGAITIAILGSGVGTSVAAAIKLASVDIAAFLGINKELESYNFLGINKNLEPYKTVVGETRSSNGVSIRLNEVVLNGNELVVSTTTKYEKSDSEVKSISAPGVIFINGKSMAESSRGIGEMKGSEMQEVMTYNLKDNELKGDLDIKIVYSLVSVDRKEVEIKPCVFEFTTNGDELYASTVEIPINHSFKLENGNIVRLNKYVGNVVDKKIFLSIQNINNSTITYNMKFKGYDDFGNKIVFEAIKIGREEGVFLLSTVAGQEINDKATEITLTPYAAVSPMTDYKAVGEKFTIKIK